MILIVDEDLLQESPVGTAELDELVDLEGDGSWCGRVRGDLHITVSASRVHVEGAVHGLLPRECDRTCRQYLEPVTATLSEVCVVDRARSAAEPARFDDDDEAWRVAPGGWLDLTEMVRQAVLLALPTKAVSPGAEAAPADRKVAEEPSPDPRLAVLRALLQPESRDDGGPEA